MIHSTINNMKLFTGFEYLCIDIANQFGLDKLKFEERIQWVKDNFIKLEQLGESKPRWKEYPLYRKAVMAMREIQSGNATGHMVGLDATCSGLQLMATMTGCYAGAEATGLIDPDERADAYTKCLDLMRQYVPALPNEDRSNVKQAVMTSLYGSQAEPKNLFGEDTPELASFYKALLELSPGACELLEDLRSSWQSYELKHSWVLPDNHHAHVKVLDTFDSRVEVDELNHSTFTYRFQDNVGLKSGLSNIANVVHSVDAYVMRSLVRRCNYNFQTVNNLANNILLELLERTVEPSELEDLDTWLTTTIERYDATGIVDIYNIHALVKSDLRALPSQYLSKLNTILNQMLQHKPFDIVPVHDEFKCHANYMNYLRSHYREILADLADSTILDDIFSHIYGKPMTFQKLSHTLGDSIRKSNYALS